MKMPQHILWGAALSVLGIASALVIDATAGGALLVLGAALQAWGLHSLGRSGPERSSSEGSDAERGTGRRGSERSAAKS